MPLHPEYENAPNGERIPRKTDVIERGYVDSEDGYFEPATVICGACGEPMHCQAPAWQIEADILWEANYPESSTHGPRWFRTDVSL